VSTPAIQHAHAVKLGRRLEYFTIAWNSLEALIALAAGSLAGSVALVGFGFDSLVEVTSGAALLWRLHHESDPHRRERAERAALRLVGVCFIILALYVAYDSLSSLWTHEAPTKSLPGILLAVVSLIVMPMLSKAKRRIAATLNSAAMSADARQTEFCTYLSAILLGGLLLHALFGFWWADPVAGLVMAPIIGKEGIAGLQDKTCVCH
jgi:divalent metal cation (Fe/Co/Zn/Cd) transporter